MKGLAGGMLSGRCFVHQCQPFAAVQVNFVGTTASSCLKARRLCQFLQTRSPAKLCHARQLHTKTVCQGTSSAATATQSPSIIYATAAGSRHDMPGHSECAARISAILSALDVSKLTSEHRPAQVCKMSQNFQHHKTCMQCHKTWMITGLYTIPWQYQADFAGTWLDVAVLFGALSICSEACAKLANKLLSCTLLGTYQLHRCSLSHMLDMCTKISCCCRCKA